MTADPSIMQALDTLKRRREELDDAIHALERVIGDTRQPASAPKPSEPTWSPESSQVRRAPETGPRRGARTDTAEAIITERPGVGVSPKELAETMAERGVPIRSADPTRAARAVGDRVRARNPNVELENGRFVYRPSESPNGTPQGGTSAVKPERFEIPDSPNQEAVHDE